LSYIGLPPKANFTSGLLDRFTSTTGTTVTLTNDISSENDIVVFVNFVKQDSTTYSVGGTGNKTLTLGGTLVSSDIVEVHYLNIVGQTVNPSANSVGNSQTASSIINGQTAETSIADSDEVLIYDASATALRKMTKANFVSGIGGTNTPIFFAGRTGGQDIGNTTFTEIVNNSEYIDTASAFNTSTGRFTVPSGQAGKYFFYATCTGDGDDNYDRQHLDIRVNGSSITQAGTSGRYTNLNVPSGGGYNTSQISQIFTLSVGDYVSCFFYQDSGNTSTLYDARVWFMGYKLIE